ERELFGARETESSASIRDRTEAARARETRRFCDVPVIHANVHTHPSPDLAHCTVVARSAALLRTAFRQLGLSARAYHRVLRLARTIADLDGADAIAASHVAEAVQYRSLERPLAAAR